MKFTNNILYGVIESGHCRKIADFKGATHSQLNWAILLCDVIPEEKTE